jgi:hypothetical protein
VPIAGLMPQCAILISTLTLFLGGCSEGDRQRLQAEMEGLVPNGASQTGECNWASGFIENAPASLACSYLANGNVGSVATVTRTKFRVRGYAVRVLPLPRTAPTKWLINGQQTDYYASVGLIAPGHPLDWQRNRLPVPPGKVGVYVQVAERQ